MHNRSSARARSTGFFLCAKRAKVMTTQVTQGKLQTEMHSKRQPPAQKANVAKETARVQANLPAVAETTAVAIPETRTAIQQFQDEDSTGAMPGRQMRFNGKEGFFYMADDESHVDESVNWVAPVDQMAIGRIRFNGEGVPPTYQQGLPYDGYRRPPRENLPDRDPAEWPLGLNGQAEDPWKDQSHLILQRADTGELVTFSTTSKTGLNAVAALSKHYDRLQKTHPDMYPIVQCKLGGFEGKYGWTHVPIFVVVGRVPKDSAAKPDSSIAADMNDAIDF
jgi:hypothetical protein